MTIKNKINIMLKNSLVHLFPNIRTLVKLYEIFPLPILVTNNNNLFIQFIIYFKLLLVVKCNLFVYIPLFIKYLNK